jgi:hypothetical protein
VIAVLTPLALAAGTLVFWATRLSTMGGNFSPLISGDLYWYFLPSYAYQARRMAEGVIPLWNPDQAVGQPFLATLQPGVLYPPRLLLLVTDPAHAMAVSLAAHLVFIVVATYAFGRALHASRLASSVAAIALGAMLGGNQFYWPSYFEAGAWWPVMALALVRVVGGGGWGWAVLLGVSGAMPVLAGGYQMTLYMGYALAVLAAGLLADRRYRRAGWGTLVLRLGVAGLVALATAAPQLLPTLAWSAETARRAAPLTDVQLDPYAWLRPPRELVRQTLLGGSGFQPFFLSIPAVALALLGFARRGALGVVMGVGTLVLYGVSLGPGSPLFPLYRVLPALAMYRFPYRLLTSVFFLVATGVALGLDVLERRRPARSPWLGTAAAVVAAAAVLALVVVPLRNRTMVPWLHARQVLAGSPLMQLAARQAGDGRIFFAGSWNLLQPRDAMLIGAHAVQDYEPLASRRLQHYLYAIAGQPLPPDDAPTPFLGNVSSPNSLAQPRLLDLVATTAIVANAPLPEPMRLDGLERTGGLGSGTLYRSPSVLPRAYTVDRARFVGSEAAALAAIQAPEFDPRGEVVLIGSPSGGGEAVAGAPAAGLGGARIVRDAVERIDVGVEPTSPAVLVLADAFAPGWEALVDGRPRRIWQANHLVRGVLLEPGDREVTFVYRAPGWRLGWVVFGAGWLAALTVVALGRQMK